MATGWHYIIVVNWAKGWYVHDTDYTSTLPRKMIDLKAPWIDTELEAAQYAVAQTPRYKPGDVPDNTAITLGDSPTWVQNGDRVNTFTRYGTFADQRVESRRVTRFNNGHARMDPTVGSAAELLIDRLDIDLRNVATGNNGGRNPETVSFRNADSAIQVGQLSAPSFQTWSWSQLDEGDGQEVILSDDIYLTLITIKFHDEPGVPITDLTDDVTFVYHINGVAATYTVVPAGEPEWTVFGHTLLYAGQKFMVSIGSVGSNTLADMAGVKVTIDFDTAPATLNRQNSDAYTP